MAKDLFPDNGDGKPAGGSGGSSQTLLLVVLLLLVVIFGYLYFFTGLIRPREEAAKTTETQTYQVRQPIPPRPGQGEEKPAATAKPEEKQQIQANTEKPAPPPQTKPAAPPPAAKPAATPVQTPPSKTNLVAAPVAKPAAVPQQTTPVKVAKAETAPARKDQPKALPANAQPTKPQQKAGVKPAVTAATVAKKTPGPAKPAVQAAKPAAVQGTYTLLVGEFALAQDMKYKRARVKKLGITPIHGKKATKPETMHRLFLADFDSHNAANQELQKLQKVTGSAFILEEKGRYAVYAGSYLHLKGASAEQKRLAGKGFKMSIKTAKVIVPATILTAGSFASSADAEKEAVTLRKQGINAKVIRIGK